MTARYVYTIWLLSTALLAEGACDSRTLVVHSDAAIKHDGSPNGGGAPIAPPPIDGGGQCPDGYAPLLRSQSVAGSLRRLRKCVRLGYLLPVRELPIIPLQRSPELQDTRVQFDWHRHCVGRF